MKIGFFGGKFMPIHTGHMHTIARAATMVDRLYVVVFTNRVEDSKFTQDERLLNPRMRTSWVGSACADLDYVHVLHIDGNLSEDEDVRWLLESAKVIQMIAEHCDHTITHVFSGEQSYDAHFKIAYPYAEHVVMSKTRNDINATLIRDNQTLFWEFIPPAVRRDLVTKVVLVGTESCGKSTLTKYLAKIYNTNYIHEIGRDVCEEYSDLLNVSLFEGIAMGQIEAEKNTSLTANRVLFVDTEAVVTQYYLNMYFEKHSDLIDEIAISNPYDLYLYLEPDVEWVDDDLRFMGEQEERKTNNEKLKQMFADRGIELHVIRGDYKQRLEKAMMLVDTCLQK